MSSMKSKRNIGVLANTLEKGPITGLGFTYTPGDPRSSVASSLSRGLVAFCIYKDGQKQSLKRPFTVLQEWSQPIIACNRDFFCMNLPESALRCLISKHFAVNCMLHFCHNKKEWGASEPIWTMSNFETGF